MHTVTPLLYNCWIRSLKKKKSNSHLLENSPKLSTPIVLSWVFSIWCFQIPSTILYLFRTAFSTFLGLHPQLYSYHCLNLPIKPMHIPVSYVSFVIRSQRASTIVGLSILKQWEDDRSWSHGIGTITTWDKIILESEGISSISFVYCRLKFMSCFYLSSGYI